MPITLYSGPLSRVDEHFIAKAGRFADEHLKPSAEHWEQNRQQPEKTLRLAISLFAGIRIPKKLGGHGGSAATIARVYEELAKVDIGFTSALAVHNNVTIAASLIKNSSLRNPCLEKLMSGEAIGAFLLTEPDAGSDAAAIQVSATEKNDTYAINGSKAWVTNGVNADLLFVFTQTDPKLSAKGIAGFVIEPGMPGISAKPAYNMLGNHAMGVNGILRENPLARQMSGARVTYYMDGTTEILNMVIGRSLG